MKHLGFYFGIGAAIGANTCRYVAPGNAFGGPFLENFSLLAFFLYVGIRSGSSGAQKLMYAMAIIAGINISFALHQEEMSFPQNSLGPYLRSPA